MNQHKTKLTKKEIKQAVIEIQSRTKKIFKNDDFDDPKKHKLIVASIPDFEEYEEKSRKARLALDASTPDFLRPCYKIGLLSAKQELHLFRKYNFHKFLASQYLEKRKIKKALAELKIADQCREIIILANVRLVISLVKKINQSENNHEDIVSEGYGLICRLVDYFDWTRGFKFSTYACNSIYNTVGRTCTQLEKHDSLHQTVQDSIEIEVFEKQQETNERDEHYKKVIQKLLSFCSSREKKVLTLRFLQGHTLVKISDMFGVSKERIRQIETRGIEKILNKAKEIGLTPDLILA